MAKANLTLTIDSEIIQICKLKGIRISHEVNKFLIDIITSTDQFKNIGEEQEITKRLEKLNEKIKEISEEITILKYKKEQINMKKESEVRKLLETRKKEMNNPFMKQHKFRQDNQDG